MIKSIKQAITQGQFVKAITLAREEVARCEGHQHKLLSELYYLLALACRLYGQHEQALGSVRQLLQYQPNHARAYQERAYAYLATGKALEAATAFYRAVQLNPALLSSWRELVKLYQEAGNHQAVTLANKQIAYLTSLPREILGARDLMYEGELHQADQVCRRFLQGNKHHPEALFLLAEIGIELKVYDEAEFLLESCLELYPDHQGAGMAHLKLLSKMGKFKQARELADRMLQDTPGNTALRTARAAAMVGIGDVEEAVNEYRALLEPDADQPALHLLLGHAYKALGNFEQAIRSYQTAYQYKDDLGDAYWSLANTKTYRFSEQEMAQMVSLVKKADIAQDDKIHILFALGKAHEDAADYARAFDCYEQGNLLKQQALGYDVAYAEKQVEGQITHCKPALFSHFSGAGEPAQDPIFIVGLPRAGSTLLEQILASHSMVDGTMELHNVLSLVSRLRGQDNRYPAILGQLDKDYYRRFGQQYLQDTRVFREDAPYFIDKMPNNFLHIGLIKLMLPNAKIIDARRDPMACCFSGFKQLFGEGQEFTYSLENMARYYNAYVKMMEHWDKVLPGAVLRVQHEDVVQDLEGQVRRLLEYCDLPFEQACVDFHQTERAIKTPSSEQVRQPIYRSGLAQWRNFESHLAPLKMHLERQD